MNYHSEDSIQIDKRGDVARKSLEWKISKLVANLVRHCDLADGETDGAVSLWSGKSRNCLRMWYDIVTLPIEKLMEQFIGVPCVQSYDMRFQVKVRRPSLILNGRIMYTKDAITQDSNIAKSRRTTSCKFAPSKGTQEES